MHECSDTAGERADNALTVEGLNKNGMQRAASEGLCARKYLVFSCVLNKVGSEST